MEQLDWSQILQGMTGGQSPSPIPLNPELSQPQVETGGPGTGPGTMGQSLLRPPYTPPPTPPQPPAGLTPNEGSTPLAAPPMALSPPGTGMRQGRQGEDELGAVLAGNAPTPLPQSDPRKMAMQAGGPGGAAGPITLGGPGGPTPFSGAGATGTPADQAKKAAGIAAALKGVQAPAAPAVQKISTPNAPRPSGTIKGGELQALLSALNAAPGASGIKLPTTLGSSIGR